MFSLAKPTTDKLEAAGINVDKFLVELTRKVMNDFGRKFYPNDPIGYVFGVHHDTAYRHVHVALLSSTLNGQGVSCSSSKDKWHESAKNRVERWDYVHERVNHLVQQELKDTASRARDQEQREIEKRITQQREENERLRDKVWQELTRIQASSNEMYLKRQRLLAQRDESDRHYARLAAMSRTENGIYQERLDQYFKELGTVKKSKEKIYFRLSNMASYGRPLGDLLSLVKQPLSSSAEVKKLIASAQQSKFICASNLRILETQRNAAREAIDFDINEVNVKIYRDRKLIEFMNSTAFNYGKFVNTENKVDSLHATIKKYRNDGIYASFIDQFNRITGLNISLPPKRNTDINPAKIIVRSDDNNYSMRLANDLSSTLDKVSTPINKAVLDVMRYEADQSVIRQKIVMSEAVDIAKKSKEAKMDIYNKRQAEMKRMKELDEAGLSPKNEPEPIPADQINVVRNPPPMRTKITPRNYENKPDRGIQF